jgi:hypothetical protein
MKHLQHTYETSEKLETCICNMGEAGADQFQPLGASKPAASSGARAPPSRHAREGAAQLADVGARDGSNNTSTSRSERAVEGRGWVEAQWTATKVGGHARMQWRGRMKAVQVRWRDLWWSTPRARVKALV